MTNLLPTITMSIHGAPSMGNKPFFNNQGESIQFFNCRLLAKRQLDLSVTGSTPDRGKSSCE